MKFYEKLINGDILNQLDFDMGFEIAESYVKWIRRIHQEVMWHQDLWDGDWIYIFDNVVSFFCGVLDKPDAEKVANEILEELGM